MATDFTTSWVEVQAFYNGTWNSVTSDPVLTNKEGRIRAAPKAVITRGKAPTEQRTAPSECDFTVNNRDGKYVNDNPNSVLRGLLGFNTPVRAIAKPMLTHVALGTRPRSATDFSTPDAAALDIVGDMEIRFDFSMTRPLKRSYSLMGKYLPSGNNRSWLLFLKNDGKLLFYWSPDGTFTNAKSATSTAALPNAFGRLTVRVQLDVDNGAAGSTTTFSYSTGLDGTFTTLGTPVVIAGVTSIFSGTAPVTIGSAADNTYGVNIDSYSPTLFTGKVFGWRIYPNITGTSVVSAGDLTGLTMEGGNTYIENGRTWTWNSDTNRAWIGCDQIRFSGKAPKWPLSVDATGNDVFSEVKAYGPLQQMNDGAAVLGSPMLRYYSSLVNIGYWPCEDGENSTQITAKTANTRPALAVNVDYGAVDQFAGSAPLPNMVTGSGITGKFPRYTAGTAYAFTWAYYIDTAAPTANFEMMQLSTTNYNFSAVMNSGGSLSFTFTNPSDTTVLSTVGPIAFGLGAVPPEVLVYVLEVSFAAGTLSWVVNWRGEDIATGYSISGSFATSSIGTMTGWKASGFPAGAGVNTLAVGHVAGINNQTTYLEDPHLRSFRGYIGENAISRMVRLAGEEGYSIQVRGQTPNTNAVLMGVQPRDTLINMLDQCADVARCVLTERRDKYSLLVITRNELENQALYPVSYTDATISGALGVDENSVVRNNVTVIRDGGSSATLAQASGKYGTQNGIYTYSDTFNLYTDDETDEIAGLIRLIGTWEDKFYAVPFETARKEVQASSTLQFMLAELDIGHAFEITNLPVIMGIRPPDCLVEKYVETMDRRLWGIAFESSPYRPYNTAQFYATPRNYIGVTNLTVGSAVSATTAGAAGTITATSAAVLETIKYPGVNIDLDIGGLERVTLTNVTGTWPTYTLSVTRGNPAIAHAVGETIRLWERRFYAF